jgi:ABC-type Zn uptake system ZnuABC Zn-binding protein ZnuA
VAANVGGDYIELTVLIPRGTDPHAYQPTSGDLQALYQADLVLLNGFELEASLEDELGSLNASVPLLSLSEGLPARTLDAQGDHGDDNNDHDEGLDPHVWFDPTYVMHWVDRIETALVRLDPDQTTGFQANADRFRDELAALDAWIVEQVASIPLNRRKLVLDHLVLGYFAERYDFEVISALVSAFSSAAEASPRELATLTELIRAEKVPAIFIGVDTNPRLAEQLAGDLGIAVVPLYTGSLSAVGGPAETYLEMMQYNVLVIQNALSSE